MNMVEEAWNAWVWCSRINSSIEYKHVKKSEIHAGNEGPSAEGGRHQSRTHVWWSENDQQMWGHAVASDLPMGGPITQTVKAPKIAEGLCAETLLGPAR
jgi:hypothetical protein